MKTGLKSAGSVFGGSRGRKVERYFSASRSATAVILASSSIIWSISASSSGVIVSGVFWSSRRSTYAAFPGRGEGSQMSASSKSVLMSAPPSFSSLILTYTVASGSRYSESSSPMVTSSVFTFDRSLSIQDDASAAAKRKGKNFLIGFGFVFNVPQIYAVPTNKTKNQTF